VVKERGGQRRGGFGLTQKKVFWGEEKKGKLYSIGIERRSLKGGKRENDWVFFIGARKKGGLRGGRGKGGGGRGK